MKSLGHVQAILSWLRALQLVVGANRSQQRRCATCLRTGSCWQSVRLLPSVVPANSVQVSHRRPTPASSWSQGRGSCLGPGFRVFSLHVKRPTSQCCSVSQYIGRKCISGSGRSTFPSGAGTDRHQATGNRAFQLLLLAGARGASYSVSKSTKVLSTWKACQGFQNRVLADGTDGTCEPQIVGLPSGRECA